MRYGKKKLVLKNKIGSMNREVAANNHCQIGKKWRFIFVLQKNRVYFCFGDDDDNNNKNNKVYINNFYQVIDIKIYGYL
jgi:hypothetical protein